MGKPHGTKEFWLAALRSEGGAFRAAVGEPGVLDHQVPSCPEWTVGDLVHHLGWVYRRVHAHANRGVTTRPTDLPDDPKPANAVLLGWWDERYADLLAMFDAIDPALPAWNWAPQAKRAEFWIRRMAHETSVHRWDAQMGVTGISEPIEAKLAVDGVTEVLDTWLPAGLRKGPLDRTGMVALHATDAEQIWYVRLRGAGIALLDTDTLLDEVQHHERVVANGSASDLLLALLGRVPFDTLTVSGDVTLLEALRTG